MTVIMCDYDVELPVDFARRLDMTVRTQRLRIQDWRIDRTRHGYHMVLMVSNRVSPLRLVLIQALLGSDFKREAYNAQRVMRLADQPAIWRKGRWNVLYHSHHRSVSI